MDKRYKHKSSSVVEERKKINEAYKAAHANDPDDGDVISYDEYYIKHINGITARLSESELEEMGLSSIYDKIKPFIANHPAKYDEICAEAKEECDAVFDTNMHSTNPDDARVILRKWYDVLLPLIQETDAEKIQAEKDAAIAAAAAAAAAEEAAKKAAEEAAIKSDPEGVYTYDSARTYILPSGAPSYAVLTTTFNVEMSECSTHIYTDGKTSGYVRADHIIESIYCNKAFKTCNVKFVGGKSAAIEFLNIMEWIDEIYKTVPSFIWLELAQKRIMEQNDVSYSDLKLRNHFEYKLINYEIDNHYNGNGKSSYSFEAFRRRKLFYQHDPCIAADPVAQASYDLDVDNTVALLKEQGYTDFDDPNAVIKFEDIVPIPEMVYDYAIDDYLYDEDCRAARAAANGATRVNTSVTGFDYDYASKTTASTDTVTEATDEETVSGDTTESGESESTDGESSDTSTSDETENSSDETETSTSDDTSSDKNDEDTDGTSTTESENETTDSSSEIGTTDASDDDTDDDSVSDSGNNKADESTESTQDASSDASTEKTEESTTEETDSTESTETTESAASDTTSEDDTEKSTETSETSGSTGSTTTETAEDELSDVSSSTTEETESTETTESAASDTTSEDDTESTERTETTSEDTTVDTSAESILG